MANISNAIEEYKEDSEAIHAFCEELYSKNFKEHFDGVRSLYTRLKSKTHPISDDELEYVLTELPLELFSAAEKLNNLRLDHEVVKLKNKETLEKLRRELFDSFSDTDVSKSAKQDAVNRSLNEKMVEYEILLSAYSSVITRVENEQSFARELIMGAKKIWDSRRGAESSNPVSPVVPEEKTELPEYKLPKQYIK